ncbi:DUF4139 domain-containing protein [Corallococcus sp. 4LFB]|uniref:DUF4139 domain-containing protein n=1 Tax=Corallococcus sp. 4LFB TaxID=3383249 RepID=UPI0039749304
MAPPPPVLQKPQAPVAPLYEEPAPEAEDDGYEEQESYKEMATFGGAPGGAPSVSRPAPPPPPMAAPKSSGAFLGGSRPTPSRSVTGAVSAPAPSMAAPRGGGGMERKRSKKRMAEDDSFDGAPTAGLLSLDEEGGGDELRRAASLEPADTLFDYDSLTLASAASPAQRGRLRPRPALMSQAMLSFTSVNVQVEVVRLEAQAFVFAESVNTVAPPTWSVPPRDSARHFDARFDAEAVADVPSDGAWHTVPMLTVPLELKAEYVCVPSVEPRVFRTVRLDNASPHPLLAGPVDVTLGDEFLMTSPLPTLGPGETQRLGLGVEEALQVARNTRFEEATGGMFGNATVLTHHVSVEVANHLSRPASIAISERIGAVPESQKDLKVEEAEVVPPWQKATPLPGEDAVEGERVWRVSVPAGEKRSMKATWVVKLPASKMLNGGNRRT